MSAVIDHRGGTAKLPRWQQLRNGFLRLIGTYPSSERIPLNERDVGALYKPEPSFTDYIPWVDFDQDSQVFLFDDGASCGALLELRAFDVEGKPDSVLDQLEQGIERALSVLPEREENPWVVQFYIQDEPLGNVIAQFRDYATQQAKDTRLHDAWLKVFDRHITQISRDKGLFVDEGSGIPWRAQRRRVRCCIYRKSHKSEWVTDKNVSKGNGSPDQQLNRVVMSFVRTLEGSGIAVRRGTGKDMYEWMAPWFNPQPKAYKDGYDFIKHRPYAGDDPDRGVGFDLGSVVTATQPASDKDGNWLFDDEVHRYIPLQAIDVAPRRGHLTAETVRGGNRSVSLWDQLPRRSIMCFTIVVRSQLAIKRHCTDMIKRAGLGSREAHHSNTQLNDTLENMAGGRRVYPLFAGILLRAPNHRELDNYIVDATTSLNASGLNPLDPREDLIARDTYIRALPMCYSVEHDQYLARRARMTYAHHIARLLPLYGRANGTGNPGMVFFNRIGELMLIDPGKDRVLTAHGLVFGPTGAGKSATLAYIALHQMAILKPRQIFIEKGESFSLLGQYYEQLGLSVNRLKFTPNIDVSLPPFAATAEAVQQIFKNQQASRDAEARMRGGIEATDAIDTDEGEDERDYLGEMGQLANLMVNGADLREVERFSRADESLMNTALIETLLRVHKTDAPHALISDLVVTLKAMAADPSTYSDKQRSRLHELAAQMDIWTHGVRGRFFNRYGTAWPAVDVTIIDMGIMTADNNRDMLAASIVSLLMAITDIGEKHQASGRQTYVYLDEGHAITGNPALVQPFGFGVKTWRKLGVWLIQATQNIVDYPDEAKVMLNLSEWWYLISLAEGDINDLKRFKNLSEQDISLLRSARKQRGAYTEGVVLSEKLKSLYRVVVPALALALAQTDPDEKAARKQLMEEKGCSELAATLHIAASITQTRESL